MAKKRPQRSRKEQHELDVVHARGRYELASRIFSGWSPLAIAALYFPIRGAVPIADAFAGKDTNVRMSFAVSIVYSAAVTAGGGALLLKNRKQSQELIRLRKRVGELES